MVQAAPGGLVPPTVNTPLTLTLPESVDGVWCFIAIVAKKILAGLYSFLRDIC